MVYAGLSEVIGSWKIIAMRLPRTSDMARSPTSTDGLSRWTHRVGATGRARDGRHPHLGTPSDLARLSVGASSVAIGELSPWRSVLPPLRAEGNAFDTGGGKDAWSGDGEFPR